MMEATHRLNECEVCWPADPTKRDQTPAGRCGWLTEVAQQPKPFGFVLRSKTQTSYPWADPRRWSDASGKCGNFRRHIGDAQVFKRLSAAKNYSALEIVPVYSDPRQTGEKALLP